MLKAFILALTFCAASVSSISAISEKQIIGSWKVKSIEMSKMDEKMTNPQQQQMAVMVKQSLIGRVFTFKANHHCSVDGPIMGTDVKDAIWSFNAKAGTLTLREVNDTKSRLMVIKPTLGSNGNATFTLADAPVKLAVVKVK